MATYAMLALCVTSVSSLLHNILLLLLLLLLLVHWGLLL
jgi:hypothetical protein